MSAQSCKESDEASEAQTAVEPSQPTAKKRRKLGNWLKKGTE